MTSPLQSLVATGTKLWLDSVDPDFIKINRKLGATGATSNPKIVADLVETGRFDDVLQQLADDGQCRDDKDYAWQMTDHLVQQAQDVFLPVWEQTRGNDGYVSFELDPLLEDPELAPSHDQRVQAYITLAKQWSNGHKNRMIKVPATSAGIDALEEIAAADVTLNVTLMFTMRQYQAARDAIWRGAQRRKSLDGFKSVYSIFISREDVYAQKHLNDLSDEAKGLLGIVNAKRIWQDNRTFWADKGLALQQEIIFASTGTKLKSDPPDKYVAALAGDGIQTNPPETNEAVEKSGKTYTRTVDQMPPKAILDEIDQKVDMKKLERVLLDEGTEKFADPFKSLLQVIAQKRRALAGKNG